MIIEVASTYKQLKPGQLAGETVVMIDALRASATIITAVANGCDRIIPVENTERAMEVYKQQIGEIILGGESEAQKIQGFHFGNSPLEYTEEVVKDKTLVYCTTNGTRAINATMGAENAFIGTLINARAVARRISEYEKVWIVCAGSKGRLSIEDFFAAGAIINCLAELNKKIEFFDEGQLALINYRNYKDNPSQLLTGSRHYERLLELGFEEDIDYCLKESFIDIVPVYHEGIITKE